MFRHLPNFITLLNLSCAFFGLLAILWGYPVWAVYMVVLAAVLDFLDGTAARLLQANSDIGKDLDSLADIVSFGVVPAMLISHLLVPDILQPGQGTRPDTWSVLKALSPVWLVLTAAVRLARFNNDPRQQHSFRGLPTPATGIFFAGYAYTMIKSATWPGSSFVFHPALTLALVFIFGFLMVAPVPMFSLKFPHFTFRGNELRIVFIGICAILLILLQWFALPVCILLYVLLSLAKALFTGKKTKEI